MAVQAGARYVSLFWNRIRDIGYDAATVVRQVHGMLRQWDSPAEIIVGSIRHIADVNEAVQAGADIVTVPPRFFPQLCAHPKTDEAVRQFEDDFRHWQGDPAAAPRGPRKAGKTADGPATPVRK
jgi:transaldolase